jgi:hypothetical protein
MMIRYRDPGLRLRLSDPGLLELVLSTTNDSICRDFNSRDLNWSSSSSCRPGVTVMVVPPASRRRGGLRITICPSRAVTIGSGVDLRYHNE